MGGRILLPFFPLLFSIFLPPLLCSSHNLFRLSDPQSLIGEKDGGRRHNLFRLSDPQSKIGEKDGGRRHNLFRLSDPQSKIGEKDGGRRHNLFRLSDPQSKIGGEDADTIKDCGVVFSAFFLLWRKKKTKAKEGSVFTLFFCKAKKQGGDQKKTSLRKGVLSFSSPKRVRRFCLFFALHGSPPSDPSPSFLLCKKGPNQRFGGGERKRWRTKEGKESHTKQKKKAKKRRSRKKDPIFDWVKP